MDFVLQKEKETEDIDVRILRDELDKQKFLHSYDAVSLEENKELVKKYGSDMYKKKIPVGSLEFVQHFLSEVHGVCKMNPIEVPDVLREMRFKEEVFHC